MEHAGYQYPNWGRRHPKSAKMTGTDAVAVARREALGRLEDGVSTSVEDGASISAAATCVHRWGIIACNRGTDVLECVDCGERWTGACTFDDDH